MGAMKICAILNWFAYVFKYMLVDEIDQCYCKLVALNINDYELLEGYLHEL